MRLGYITAVLLLLRVLSLPLSVAQEQDSSALPISTYTAITIGVGGMYNTDQFLSPLPYGGKAYEIGLHTEAPFSATLPCMIMVDGAFDYALTLNPARNASMTYYRAELHPQVMYLWSLPYDIKFLLGPGLRLGGGGRLHSRNSNNPGSVDLKGDLTVSALVAYRLPSEHWPIAIRLSTTCGLLGFANSIGYGQSYYEQEFLAGGLMKSFSFTAPHNTFYSTSQMRIDIPLWNVCTLQLGYRLQYDYTQLKGLERRHIQHMGMVGFSFESLSFMGRRAARGASHRPFLFGN